MAQLTIRHGDVELATEAFGDPSDPALVLIMGAMASMLGWPEEFCDRMAASDRYVIRYDMDRARCFASVTNHFSTGGGDEGSPQTAAELSAPLLVIHGTADPIFPFAHGEALAKVVAGAKLQRIEGGGHELHKDDWPQIVGAIISHTENR